MFGSRTLCWEDVLVKITVTTNRDDEFVGESFAGVVTEMRQEFAPDLIDDWHFMSDVAQRVYAASRRTLRIVNPTDFIWDLAKHGFLACIVIDSEDEEGMRDTTNIWDDEPDPEPEPVEEETKPPAKPAAVGKEANKAER
jgi:hypothetical protein